MVEVIQMANHGNKTKDLSYKLVIFICTHELYSSTEIQFSSHTLAICYCCCFFFASEIAKNQFIFVKYLHTHSHIYAYVQNKYSDMCMSVFTTYICVYL